MPEGGPLVLRDLRHDDNRVSEGVGSSSKLRGMVIAATGAGIMVFGFLFRAPDGLLLMGFIPVLVGTVMLVHAFVVKPGTGNEGKADSGLNHE